MDCILWLHILNSTASFPIDIYCDIWKVLPCSRCSIYSQSQQSSEQFFIPSQNPYCSLWLPWEKAGFYVISCLPLWIYSFSSWKIEYCSLRYHITMHPISATFIYKSVHTLFSTKILVKLQSWILTVLFLFSSIPLHPLTYMITCSTCQDLY